MFIYLKSRNPYKTYFVVAFVFIQSPLAAQNNVLGGWYLVNLNYHLNKKFTLYSEIQTRSQHVLNDFYYRELKGGVSYNFPGKQSVFVGFGNYKTYTYPGNFKELEVNENRIWEQFNMSHNIGRVKIEHRYRIEQRWLNGDYFNRFRYRLATTTPINHSRLTDNTLFMSVYDEIFFTDKPPYFIRNRIFLGPGYQFSKLLTIQTGFLRQFDYRTSDNGSGKNYIVFSLLFIARKVDPEKSTHHEDAD